MKYIVDGFINKDGDFTRLSIWVEASSSAEAKMNACDALGEGWKWTSDTEAMSVKAMPNLDRVYHGRRIINRYQTPEPGLAAYGCYLYGRFSVDMDDADLEMMGELGWRKVGVSWGFDDGIFQGKQNQN